jgi:hypothetical protein
MFISMEECICPKDSFGGAGKNRFKSLRVERLMRLKFGVHISEINLFILELLKR